MCRDDVPTTVQRNMVLTGGRDDGESRAAEGEEDRSSSDESDHEEDEIATISDVFADMLIANEDLLHAAAAYQLDSDVPSILAYQRILHHNLIEMADFVDSVFGVYKKSSLGDSAARDVTEDDEETAQDNGDAALCTDPQDDVNGHTSEEATEPAAAKNAQPERMRSLLIDRFRLENKRRMEQRTARLWRKMRRKVRVEEGVSVVMTHAAERIAQMTVSVAAARDPPTELVQRKASRDAALRETENATTATSEPSSTPTLLTAQPSDALIQPPPQQPSNSESSPVEQKPTTVAPSAVASVPSAVVTASNHATAIPQPALQHLPMPMLATPMPFLHQTGAMLLPVGANNFTKMPLPPMSSGLNMLYTMSPPTLFPPNHMSSVCSDCVPLNRTAHECRSVLKHITPPPPSVQPMVFGAPSMWPMTFNGIVSAPQPMRSVPPMRTSQPAASSTFKKMCEECKKNHKSVHHCRKILGHTAPEWLSELPESDPKPRKRRTRRTKAVLMTERLSGTPETATASSCIGSGEMAANEI